MTVNNHILLILQAFGLVMMTWVYILTKYGSLGKIRNLFGGICIFWGDILPILVGFLN